VESFEQLDLQTPALVYEEATLLQVLNRLIKLKEQFGIHVLYSMKALCCPPILEIIAKHVDGFSASSLFEAILARKILGRHGSVHVVSPAFADQEISEISDQADYISFNSLSQWQRFEKLEWKGVRLGLRVNPQLSFVKDERYDPCRKSSKLGIPMDHLIRELETGSLDFKRISGIHIHTNCEARSWDPLLQTVIYVYDKLNVMSGQLSWINLGGGYLYNEIGNDEPLARAIEYLKKKNLLNAFIEPGDAVVSRSGHLVSTVLDIFESDGKKIAMLDSTINHMPQIFEYQYQPEIHGNDLTGKFTYVIAGRSCLAGDLFGEYTFTSPLKIGSRIIFNVAGAYTLVKSHMFNGINLPSVYLLTKTGHLSELRKFSFQDFWSECGGYPEKIL
jgi:carboxynorspermidine decarboxylase